MGPINSTCTLDMSWGSGGPGHPLPSLRLCPPQHTRGSWTSGPYRRKRPFTWQPAEDTWIVSSACSRQGLSLTSPTSPERRPSTKVSSPNHQGLIRSVGNIVRPTVYPQFIHSSSRCVFHSLSHNPSIPQSVTVHPTHCVNTPAPRHLLCMQQSRFQPWSCIWSPKSHQE